MGFKPQKNGYCRSQVVGTLACILMLAGWRGLAQESVPPDASKPSAQPKRQPTQRELRDAESSYLTGVRLLDRGDLAGAEDRFTKAATLNPDNSEYLQAAALAHEHRVSSLVLEAGRERMMGHADRAANLLAEARTLDPENNIVTQHIVSSNAANASAFQPRIEAPLDDRAVGARIAGPVTLEPNPGKQSFQIRADQQQAVREVLARYGIRAVFDESLQPAQVRVDLDDVTYDRASEIVFEMTGTFAVPLDPHSVIIAKDKPENRQRLERQLQETIYVPGFTPEQMNELGNVVRSVFDVRQATVLPNSGSLALRAPEDTLNALNLTLADLINGGAEVVIDMRLYLVDRTRQRDIGINLPQQIGVYNVEAEARNLVQQNQALVNQAISQGLIPANATDIQIALALISSGLVQSSLLSNTLGFFGGGLTMSGLTTNAATTFKLALNSSDTRALDSIELRAGDRKQAVFRSGTRYPIITSTYTTGVPGNSSSLAGTTINGVSAQSLLNQLSSVTIPQIQFEDLGLTLTATPSVQRSGLVRMDLELKIEALGGTSINNIPILASRQYKSNVTVRDGETTLIASTLSRSESAAVSGIPLLGELPGFQTATADKTTEHDTSELVMLITPRIVRHRLNETAGPRIAFNQRLPN